MKLYSSLLLCLFFIFNSNAQDTIRKKTNEILIGTVKEITDADLLFIRSDQPNGPVCRIDLSKISEVRYSNGTKEIFKVTTNPTSEKIQSSTSWEPGAINNSGRTIIIPRRGPDFRVGPGQRFPYGENTEYTILNSGVFIDGMIGYGQVSVQPSSLNNANLTTLNSVAFGARFGSKYYFGAHEKRRFGLNLSWVNFTVAINELGNTHVFFSPVSLGPSMVYKLKEKTGFEINPTVGLSISDIYVDVVGIRYGIDVKWRYEKLAIGIDFSRSNSIFDKALKFSNIFSLSAGVKF